MKNSKGKGRWEFDQEGNAVFVEEEASGGSSGGKRGGDEGWHWILIVLGFVLFWPVGLVLLFLHLSGKWPGSQRVERELHRAAGEVQRKAKEVYIQVNKERPGTNYATPEEARRRQEEIRQAHAAQAKARQSGSKKRQGKKDPGAAYGLGHVRAFRVAGGIMAGVFGFAFLTQLVDEIQYFYSWGWLVGETAPGLALCLAGVALIGVGERRRRKLRHFEKYLSMIGSRTIVPLASLAKAMGISEGRVEKDLEEMLERGFWEEGYVDAARRALILGGPLEEEPEPQPEPPREENDTAEATLRHIRQVNEAIANPELSAQIDRIEELTAKIFQLVQERPEKAGELRSFMNYYLPQTLKILERYSRLEAQGIEGENIAEAKGKIEGMMDKLVDGYETQLDKLFADDVLDISADLKVMESMLEKDGLTGDSQLKF